MALGWFGGSKEASLGDLIAARKYAKAIEVLRAQFQGGARDPRLRLQLADVLVLAGRVKEATPILNGLADEYAREGYAAKAIAVLKKLQKVAPGQPDVEKRLAELLHRRLRPADPPAARPGVAAFEPAPFEFGMEEVGDGSEIAIGEPVAAAPAPTTGGEAAVVASAAPPTPAPDPKAEEEFFDTLQDIVDEGAIAAAAEVPAGGGASGASGAVPSPLFGGFSEAELGAVISRLQLLSFEAGDIVVTEGQKGDGLFVLTTGLLKAFVRDQGGRNVPVREMPEGSFFGEISMIRDEPRSATVTCATRCEMLALDRKAFEEIAALHPRVRQVVQETYEARAGSLEEMLAREGWDGPPPEKGKAPSR